MRSPDVIVAGAGLVGVACALACHRRGLRVLLLEAGSPAREASWAAAGMLAAHDHANPAQLRGLADLSLSHYPAFLADMRALSGESLPIETEWTLEQSGADETPLPQLPWLRAAGDFRLMQEQSLDPRGLAAALPPAVAASGIPLHTDTRMIRYRETPGGVLVETDRERLQAGALLDCTGAWHRAAQPAKGQMLRLLAPGAMAAPGLGNVVVRSPEIYLVPRLDGTVVIGATVEDAGFDKTLFDSDLRHLRTLAEGLVPALSGAPEVERWAGLRPDTPDHLPLLGATGDRTFAAAGHFRNGILLAPGTAVVMAELLLGEQPSTDLSAFDPLRFASTRQPGENRTIFAQT